MRHRLGGRSKILIGVGVALVCLGGLAGTLSFRSPRQTLLRQVVALAPPPPPISILVMGRQAQQFSALTDSMMLVAVSPGGKFMGLLSVPRDLWVDIPGHGYSRINEAYVDGGAPLAERVVQQVTGIRPDYYLFINYAGFAKLIDAVGGVTVDVPYAINDPTFPAPDECCGHYAPLHIPAGVQHMNGQTALDFVRERHDLPQGDLSREANQQALLLALKSQFLRPANVLRVPTLLADLHDAFTTDFPLSHVPGYAAAVATIPQGSVRHAVLNYADGAVSDWTTPGGAYVLLPHNAAIAHVVQHVFGGILPDIAQPTETIDPHSLQPQPPAAPSAPAPASSKPAAPVVHGASGIRFLIPNALGAGTLWHAPLLSGSLLAELPALLGHAVPVRDPAAAGPAMPGGVTIGLANGTVERLQAARGCPAGAAPPACATSDRYVLLGGRPFASAALAALLPRLEGATPLVPALAANPANPAAHATLGVRGEGWVGARVALTLVLQSAAGTRRTLTVGQATPHRGSFAWSGRLPAGAGPGVYILQARDGVRSASLLLPIR